VFIKLYLQLWTFTGLKNFFDKSKLRYVSSATGTFIAVMVWELLKLEDDVSVLSEIWDSFCCALFPTTLTA
jgi:hypothetical protein